MGTSAEGKLAITASSKFPETIRNIATSTYMASMATFAKFTSLTLSNLLESRPIAGWEAVGRLLDRFKQLASTLEQDWSNCPLADLSHDTDVAGKRTALTSRPRFTPNPQMM